MLLQLCLASVLAVVVQSVSNEIPPYIQQCNEEDPELIKCFMNSLHHLRPYLATGIPEIELPTVEPFLMDELTLSLTTGPNGYKITMKDLEIYGSSNFTVKNLVLSENGKPFTTEINIPHMKIQAPYTSSGILLIVPASGHGVFHATLEDVKATLTGTVSKSERDGYHFLKVDKLDMNMVVKNSRMNVKKINNNNRILIEAVNLFLREHSGEVFKIMSEQLTGQLAAVFKKITNQLLIHVPVEHMMKPKSS